MLRNLIHRPIAVSMSLLATVILGLLALRSLPVSLLPDMAIPKITIQVNASNYSAREVESVLVSPLRNQLREITAVRNLKAESRDGIAFINLEFDYKADINLAFIEVNEKIDLNLPNLPQNIERPKVIKATANDIPAFYLDIRYADDREVNESSLLTLSELTSELIVKRIEQLPEVAMVDASGLSYPEISIFPDLERLKAMDMTVEEIADIVRQHNLNVGSLTIKDGHYQYNVTIQNRLNSVEDIGNIYFKKHDRLYRISDVANIVQNTQARQNIVRSNGEQAISLAIVKQSDAQMSDLREDITALIENFEKDYPELKFSINRDQTFLLEYSINNLISNIIAACLLACVIIFFFMNDFRSPFLISLSVPLSLVISFLFFKILNISINIISLSGLILCVGMMVDNAIIIIDNIKQHLDAGETLSDSIVCGTKEVFTPLLSSALTTCSIFVPLIFLSGITGAIFYDQAMAIIIGLSSSLIVSLLIVPVYYRLLYRNPNRKIRPAKTRVDRFIDQIEIIVGKLLDRPVIVMVITGMFIFSGLVSYRFLDKQKLPDITETDFQVYIDWNDMITVEENDARIQTLMNGLNADYTYFGSMSGTQQFMLSHTPIMNLNEALLYIQMEDPLQIPGLKTRIQESLYEMYPESESEIWPSVNIFNTLFADDEDFLVAKLYHETGNMPSYEELNSLLSNLYELGDVQYRPVLWNEYIYLRGRAEEMALYGIDPERLLAHLRNTFHENEISSITTNSSPLRIKIGYGTKDSSFWDFAILSPDSVSVPLRRILTEYRERDFKTVFSDKSGSYYPVSINADNRNANRMIENTRTIVNQADLFNVEFEGTFFTVSEMVRELFFILFVAFCMLFLILAGQFESLVQPAIILSELLIDLSFVFLFLACSGISVNLMTLIGLVVVTGIIINDSILKVDTINRLRKEGFVLREAVLTAGKKRFKPIVMTSLTTILAVIPFLFRGNMGADLQYPFSVVIIVGMAIGTLVSIFYIPVIYYVIYRKKHG